MILYKSFEHGWFYHYRLHKSKLDSISKDFNTLKIFLENVLENCPDDYFRKGPRISKQKINLKAELYNLKGHEISKLAEIAMQNKTHSPHTTIQLFMLNHDNATIATEVPLWLEENEMQEYKHIFNSSFPVTGHIDVLRIEDNKIWIWDYKPKAYKEKYAPFQVYFYARMLSKRTNIPLENFRCGYFDENEAYVFDPNKAELIWN